MVDVPGEESISESLQVSVSDTVQVGDFENREEIWASALARARASRKGFICVRKVARFICRTVCGGEGGVEGPWLT